MTPQEKQEFERLKKELSGLKESFYRGDFPGRKEYTKQIVSMNKILANENGIKFSSATYGNGPEIRCGNQIDDTGIKAQVGTLPNGSLYLSSASAQPFFIMVGTTWTLLNIP